MPFLPDIPEPYLALAAELGVRDEDLDEQFTRGGGKGGQKINKTSSTVLLTHRPSGTTVRVQEYREQHKNRLEAYKLLLRKLEEQVKGKESKIQQSIFKIRKQKARRNRKAKNNMLAEKHHRADIKDQRKRVF